MTHRWWHFRTLSLVCLALLVPFLFSCGGAEELFEASDQEEDRTVVNYGHVPSVSTTETMRKLRPLKEHLENKLDIELRIEFASDYGQMVEQLEEGQFDFVTLGPLSYVQASERGVAEAVVKPKRFGSEFYRSMIITHADSPYETIEDLKNARFAFVDRSSASGYLFPRAYVSQESGTEFADYVRSYDFLGDHTNVVMNVWLEEYDVGAVYEDARQDVDNSDRVIHETRVIARTDQIPNEPWAFNSSFQEEKPDLASSIRETMLGLDDAGPSARRILDSLEVDGFVRATDSDYDVVREYRDVLPGKDVEGAVTEGN